MYVFTLAATSGNVSIHLGVRIVPRASSKLCVSRALLLLEAAFLACLHLGDMIIRPNLSWPCVLVVLDRVNPPVYLPIVSTHSIRTRYMRRNATIYIHTAQRLPLHASSPRKAPRRHLVAPKAKKTTGGRRSDRASRVYHRLTNGLTSLTTQLPSFPPCCLPDLPSRRLVHLSSQ